jgi:hypothetical protein
MHVSPPRSRFWLPLSVVTALVAGWRVGLAAPVAPPLQSSSLRAPATHATAGSLDRATFAIG